MIVTYSLVINDKKYIDTFSKKGATRFIETKLKNMLGMNWSKAVKDGFATLENNFGEKEFTCNDLTYKIVKNKEPKEKVSVRIKNIIGVNGLFPFEHGFNKPILVIGDKKVEVYEMTYDNIRTSKGKFKYHDFNDNELNKLFKSIIEYTDYCANDA